MFKWLTKLFKNSNDKALDMESDNVEKNNTSSAVAAPKKRKHKLEIQVYEADYDNVPDGAEPKWRPVRTDPALDGGRPNIIEVADKAELAAIQKQYAMCDQRIKVLREIDPFVDDEHKHAKQSTIP